MNRTPSLPATDRELPDRSLLVDYAYVAYFVALTVAPLAVPPFAAEATTLAYDEVLLRVLPVVGLGYAAGLAALLRPR